MKTLKEIEKLNKEFTKRFGLEINGFEQGSPEWRAVKLGVLSASNASKIVAKKGSQTRATYMAELVGQVATGLMKELSAKPLEWGKSHEDAARSAYEFQTDTKIEETLFIFKDKDFRAGCSPDGLILSKNRGAEIKCPYNTENYIQFLVNEKIKPEYEWQCQFSMWVSDAGSWDYGNYDPRMKKMPLKFITIDRDSEKQKKLDDSIPEFILEMDKMLASIGIGFGDHWKDLAKLYKVGA